MITVKNVLLIDIPTYGVSLPDIHRNLIEKKLIVQTSLWEKRTGHKMIRPGLTYSRGLLTIAACLERESFSVKYLIYSDPLDRAKIIDFAEHADVIAINALTPTIKIAQAICEEVKIVNPRVITILGGPHISAMPIQSLEENSNVDFALIGEAEERLPKFLGSITKPDEVGGVVYRNSDGSVSVSRANIAPVNIAELPIPAYHLLSRHLSEYAHNIKAVRGCPYKCNFCFERLSWHSPALSVHKDTQIIDELKLLAKNIGKGALIHFSDAIFNLRWETVTILIEQIKRLNLDVLFSMDTRVDFVKSEQIKQLANTGFVYFRMGFESLQDNVLDISEKSITQRLQIEASNIIRDVAPQAAILAYMITGLPGSTRESVANDVYRIRKMVEDGLVDVVSNKVLVPYPDTPYFENANNLGIEIKTKDWSKYDRLSYPVYRLKELSSDEIYFGYLNQEVALTEAYSDKLKSAIASLENVKEGLGYIFQNYAQK